MRTVAAIALLAAAGLLAGAGRMMPLRLAPPPARAIPVLEVEEDRACLRLPGRYLVAEVAAYGDELLAWLVFSHLREAVPGVEALLTYREREEPAPYAIVFHFTRGDLLAALPELCHLRERRVIPGFEWQWVARAVLARQREQTRFLIAAYNLPPRKDLSEVARAEAELMIAPFLRFKSMTDRRVRHRIEPVPRPLSTPEARVLAADIIAVAEFYDLPLDLFLGIGAMENNYMNVPGDLEHTVWKRRAEPGDAVVERRRGRVRVRNEALGPWQITRESLRLAHRLYLKDTRDYCRLPEHLVPPMQLELDAVRPETLTTYAGLLFRTLLDRFDGDAAKAVGAYNGGPRRPNMQYQAGVAGVAAFARDVMLRAAALGPQPAASMQFFAPPAAP